MKIRLEVFIAYVRVDIAESIAIKVGLNRFSRCSHGLY